MDASQILREIVEREHPITVRGAFSRAVSAGLYPGTDDEYYKKCAKELQELRGAYVRPLPYDWIIDSSRSRDDSTGFDGLESYLDTVSEAYRRNYWLDQPIAGRGSNEPIHPVLVGGEVR